MNGPTGESDHAWLALLCTGVSFGLSVVLFVFVLAEPAHCGERSTPTLEKAFLGMLLVTSVLGILTAAAAIVARRRHSDAAVGSALGLGLLAPVVCVVMFFVAVAVGLAPCAN